MTDTLKGLLRDLNAATVDLAVWGTMPFTTTAQEVNESRRLMEAKAAACALIEARFAELEADSKELASLKRSLETARERHAARSGSPTAPQITPEQANAVLMELNTYSLSNNPPAPNLDDLRAGLAALRQIASQEGSQQ